MLKGALKRFEIVGDDVVAQHRPAADADIKIRRLAGQQGTAGARQHAIHG
jgi:hypothetical protein